MKSLLAWIGYLLLIGAGALLIARPFSVEWLGPASHPDLLSRALGILLLATVLCLVRIMRGPTPADRIVAIDILGILIVGLCAVLAAVTQRSWYIDIGMVWALQSFIGSLALAKYLEGRSYDE